MDRNQNSPSPRGNGRYLVALLFIGWGVLLFAHNIALISTFTFNVLTSWQMILIVIGAYLCFRKQFWGGVILLALGAYFLNFRFGWINGIDFRPSALILIGVFIALRLGRKKPCCNRQRAENMTSGQYTSTDGFFRSDNVFGGVRQVVLDDVFKGGTIRNNFGGTAIDLRRSTIPEGETFLDLECNFGGVEIYVPAEWNVKFLCNAFLGGCEDKRFGTTTIDQTRVLVIRGNVSFGGVEIKN